MIARVALAALALLPVAADDPLAGRVAGKPSRCLDTYLNNTVQIVDAHTILYSSTRRRMWRTGPDDACPGLEPNASLIIEPIGDRLCAGDRFRVRRPSDPIASITCRFTAFTPYDLPPS